MGFKKKKSTLGFEKNDQIELEITGMTAEGNGVGRYREVAIFVPNAAIGDRLRIRVVKTTKNLCVWKNEEIPSIFRSDSGRLSSVFSVWRLCVPSYSI